MDDRVVITGTGIVCSLGSSAGEVWDAFLSGKDGVRPLEGFPAEGFDCSFGARIEGLDPADLGIAPRNFRIMDIHSYMLMKCARDAFLQSALDAASIPKEEIGFFAGMGMVDYKVEDLLPAVLKSLNGGSALDYESFYSQGYKEIYPLWPLSMLNNISFCHTAISLDIRGENTVFSPHADSGAQAVAEGVKTILDEKSQAVLAGGVSEKISPLSLARSGLSGILNTEKKKSGGICRPFGADRSGTVLGEGCGVLALELHSSAAKRGVACLASITGYGAACETERDRPGPTARAISLSMEHALESADLAPSDIDVVIAHGDGTRTGDGNEIEAIHRVFSERIETLHVFSSKGALGHLLAGAPLVDIILGISMLRSGVIPATLNSAPPESSIRFNLVSGEPIKADPKKILINCRSCEGQSASLIIEAAGREEPREISVL